MKVKVFQSPEDPDRRIVVQEYSNFELTDEMHKGQVEDFIEKLKRKAG